MSSELPSCRVDAGTLLQHVSRTIYRGTPLYYGRDGANRYDDPARAYGVLYLGRDLPTALMESVFHKHQWLADTNRSIALEEVRRRFHSLPLNVSADAGRQGGTESGWAQSPLQIVDPRHRLIDRHDLDHPERADPHASAPGSAPR